MSFVGLLLPAILADRLGSRKSAADAAAELRHNRHLNSMLRHIMAAEYGFIRRGVNFSLGGSRLLVARKING